MVHDIFAAAAQFPGGAPPPVQTDRPRIARTRRSVRHPWRPSFLERAGASPRFGHERRHDGPPRAASLPATRACGSNGLYATGRETSPAMRPRRHAGRRARRGKLAQHHRAVPFEESRKAISPASSRPSTNRCSNWASDTPATVPNRNKVDTCLTRSPDCLPIIHSHSVDRVRTVSPRMR